MYTFDNQAHDRTLKFWKLCNHKRKLLAWQDDFLKAFGWIDDTGLRKTKRIYLQIARGNGKTTFAGTIGLHMLVNDGEEQADVAIAASSREQAGHVFRECCNLVRNCPRLNTVLHLVPSKKEIHFPKRNAILRVISHDAKQGHGHNLHCLIIDEAHTFSANDVEFLNALERGAGKFHRNSLICYLTTAGYDKLSPCYDYYLYSKSVQSGTLKDDTWLPLIYEADPALPDDSLDNWKKANPALNILVTEKQLREDYEFSKTSNASLSTFKRQRLNLWTSAESSFLDIAHWDRNKTHYPDLTGCPIVLGADLSGGASDLTALAGVVTKDDKLYTFSWAWTTTAAMERNKVVNWQTFIDADELQVVDGNVIDFTLLRNRIAEIGKIYPIQAIVFDKWGSNETTQALIQSGYNVFTIPPTVSYFNEPTRKLEKYILDGKCVNDGNALLRFCLANLEVKEQNGLIRPVKSTESAKVDCAVALIQALSQVNLSCPARKSVYEEKGLCLV